jgi:homoserine O-acetyltransferase
MADERAPDVYYVGMETSKGRMVMEVRRAWAPRGADRFYDLVRSGYYDGSRFFRIRAGQWVQFGIAGDPAVARAWRPRSILDDPVALPQVSNVRGTVAFAFAVKDGRTTQVFINLRDNSATHDAPADGMAFVPFGRVVEGMEVADALYGGYGETAGGGIRGSRQEPLFEGGNAYLDREFPLLDRLERARIMP